MGAQATQLVRDVRNGPEAYLQMWERARGIVGDSCRKDVADLSKGDLARVKPGMTPEQVLVVLGQPHARSGEAFAYCGPGGAVAVRFDGSGRVSRVG